MAELEQRRQAGPPSSKLAHKLGRLPIRRGMKTGSGRKSWQEKMADKKGLPKILKLEKRFPCYNATHKMGAKAGDKVVLVNPGEIIQIMKKVRKGKLITITEICKTIAKDHHVKACCTLTTGIFIMTAANATEEAAGQGRNLGIPYWRTLKANGFLNEKYPGGAQEQKKLLEMEGFKLVQKGKKYLVQDYQDFLICETNIITKKETR